MIKNCIFIILMLHYTSAINVASNSPSKYHSHLVGTSSNEPYIITCSSTSRQPVGSYSLSLKWIYYTYSPTVNVQIFGGYSFSMGSTYFNTSLKLDSYNSGFYECQYMFGDELVIQDIQIAKALGADLNDNCKVSSDCNALNGQCTSSTCQCVQPYDINFNGMDTTPACLTHESVGQQCNIDEECAVKDSDVEYTCANSICVISGDNNSGGSSAGAIAEIVIGSLIGVALIGGII